METKQSRQRGVPENFANWMRGNENALNEAAQANQAKIKARLEGLPGIGGTLL